MFPTKIIPYKHSPSDTIWEREAAISKYSKSQTILSPNSQFLPKLLLVSCLFKPKNNQKLIVVSHKRVLNLDNQSSDCYRQIRSFNPMALNLGAP